MYVLYDFIFLVFAFIYLPYLFFTHRYHSRLVERLGVFDKRFLEAVKGERIVWLHAVSVGEVIASSPFIKEFHVAFPDYRLLISTVTKTGNSIASKIKGNGDFLIYFPLDLSFVIRKVLTAVKPRLFIIMETEIWPNIITAFYRRGIPIIVMNGRLSRRSFGGYQKVAPFLKGVMKKINLFCMQTATDAGRLAKLGVDEKRIRVTGNMKYDAASVSMGANDKKANGLLSYLKKVGGRRIFVAGSTHRGEEEIILDAYRRLLKQFPGLLLIIAPRHTERAQDIERMALKRDFKCRFFSLLEESALDLEVIILDIMGALKDIYALSDAVFIGGSLLSRYGGHNPLEPAVFQKPILFGAYMSNFRDMADEFLREEAAMQAGNVYDIEEACAALLSSPGRAEEMGRRALCIMERNKGATQKNLKYVKNILMNRITEE